MFYTNFSIFILSNTIPRTPFGVILSCFVVHSWLFLKSFFFKRFHCKYTFKKFKKQILGKKIKKNYLSGM